MLKLHLKGVICPVFIRNYYSPDDEGDMNEAVIRLTQASLFDLLIEADGMDSDGGLSAGVADEIRKQILGITTWFLSYYQSKSQ